MIYEKNINELNFVPNILMGAALPLPIVGTGLTIAYNSFWGFPLMAFISIVLAIPSCKKYVSLDQNNEKQTDSYLATVIKDKPLKDYHLLTVYVQDLDITHKLKISNEEYNVLNNHNELFVRYDIYTGKKIISKPVKIATNPRLVSIL